MSILQPIYIFIFNLLFKVTGKIPERVRDGMMQLLWLFPPFYFIFYFTVLLNNRELGAALHMVNHTQRHIICGLVLGLIIVLSVNKPLEKVKWNPWISWPLMLVGLGIWITSFLHPIGDGYRMFGLMILVEFPALYFVWNNRRDYQKLYDAVAFGVLTVGLLHFAYCGYLAANGMLTDEGARINAGMENSNLFSMVGMTQFSCSLYLLVSRRRQWVVTVLAALDLGVGASIMSMGQSRLSVAASVINVGVVIVFYLIHCEKQWVKDVMVTGLIVMLCAGAGLALGEVMQQTNTRVVEQTVAVEPVVTETPAVAAPQTAVPAADEDVGDRFIKGGDDDLNRYTSGRIEIWKGYAQFLNWTGNDVTQADWTALTNDSVVHAHNNFLELSFRCGVIVGGIFILAELIAGICGILLLFRKKYQGDYLLFPILFLVIYAFESMFDIATIPFEREAPYYYYLALTVLMDGALFAGSKKAKKS